MKICSNCKNEKNKNEFNKSKELKDGLSSWCKESVKIRSKKYYQDNKELITLKTKNYKDNIRLFINEFKEKNGCEKCGENKFYLLDFHHIDPKQKDFNISVGASGPSIEKIKEEIKKCVLLCSNHHREFHYLERSKNLMIEQYLKNETKTKTI